MTTFINACRAEYLKLRTTASLWWTSVFFLLAALAALALMGLVTRSLDEGVTGMVTPASVLGGLVGVAPVLVIVQATMTVTTEYRYGVQATTLLATPRRLAVAAAKLLVYAAHAVALTLVAMTLAYLIAGALLPGLSPVEFFGDPEALWMYWALPLGIALLVALAQGVAMLVRNTAGTVVALLAWVWVVESAISFAPRIGPAVQEYLPSQHFYALVTQEAVPGWGGPLASGAYFALWAVAIWGLGFLAFSRRDA